MRVLNPNIYVKSVYDIDYLKLKKLNIKLLCFDLDNTLAEPDKHNKIIDYKLDSLFKDLQKDFEIMVVSNNTIKNRVKSFADLYSLNYIESMRKPFLKNYYNDRILSYKKYEILFVGDKIVTDVLGAKRFGSYSALVDPLFPKKKVWYNKVMNIIDMPISCFSGVKKKEYFDKL